MKLNRLPHYAVVAALCITLAVICSLPALAMNVRFRTAGTFVDRTGGQHPWSINEAHTLIWESQPYIPVGSVFVSKYAGTDATDANYQADVSALETLKAKGITDIILKTGKPITSCDPAALQKIIDYLDSSGFCYGLEFSDGPKNPISGYVVSPGKYKLDGPGEDATISVDWPGVDSAMFVVVSKFNGGIIEQGGAIVRDGKATMKLNGPLTSSSVLLVYPRKNLRDASGGIGDIWTGFGEYRDRVLAYMKNVKFGSGLRFFLEPFTSKLDFSGDMANIIPDSPGFRLGLEGYLMRKHVHEGSLNAAWGMTDQIPNAEKASRLMPMWASGYGLPFLYDRASAQFYTADTSNSSYWRDVIDYRDMSTQEYMNTIADTLRKQVANVPVIFKSSRYHRLYANPFGMGGHDGLGVEAYGTGEAPVTRTAGGIFSLAEESNKCTWFIVAGTRAGTDGAGYSSESVMTGTLSMFREVGCKGFFVEGLQESSGADQVAWLRSFKDKLNAAAMVDFKPTVINYPAVPATGAYVKRIAPNTWWLPTLRMGKIAKVGEGLCAYSILGEGRSYIWSNSGPRTITLKTGPAGLPSVDYPGKNAIVDKKKGLFAATLTDSPLVLRGLDFEMLFPIETAEKCISRLSDSIAAVERMKGEVGRAKMGLENARSVLSNGNPAIAFGMAEAELNDLLDVIGSNTWVEGEQIPTHNWDSVVAALGASNALALVLDTEKPAPLAPYSVSFQFVCKENASYEVWIAGTPPSDASPVSFCVDDVGWTPVSAVNNLQEYAQGLAWYRIGTVNVFSGKHTLKIRVDGPRQRDGRFYFALDAVVLSPGGFKPNGISRM